MRNALRTMADEWIALVETLQQAQIAHGDLQHDTVVVGSNGLKLLHYDAMYMPALLGAVQREVGRNDYQHQERDSQASLGRTWIASLPG